MKYLFSHSGFVLFSLFVAGGIIGVVIGQFFWLSLRKKWGTSSKSDRRRYQLISTQQNITGRIKNALNECLPANLQWGHRLSGAAVMGDSVSTFMVFDCEIVPAPIVTKVTVICDFVNFVVVVATSEPWRWEMYTDDPNDPNLTLLIGMQMDILKKWLPTIPIAS